MEEKIGEYLAINRCKVTECYYFYQLNSQTGVVEVGTAIKFLQVFPPANQLACRAAYNLCSTVGNSAHLTPGPALKERLKHSYFRSTSPSNLQQGEKARLDHLGTTPTTDRTSRTDWTQASFHGAWEWVRRGMEIRVREWRNVGVAVDDVMALVERARSQGDRLDRLVE